MSSIYLKSILTYTAAVVVKTLRQSGLPADIWYDSAFRKMVNEASLEFYSNAKQNNKIEGGIFFIVDKSTEEIVGLTGYYPIDDKHVGLRWHGITRTHRRKGYSHQAILELLKLTCSNGAILVEVSFSEQSKRYFINEGFAVSQDKTLLDKVIKAEGCERGSVVTILTKQYANIPDYDYFTFRLVIDTLLDKLTDHQKDKFIRVFTKEIKDGQLFPDHSNVVSGHITVLNNLYPNRRDPMSALMYSALVEAKQGFHNNTIFLARPCISDDLSITIAIAKRNNHGYYSLSHYEFRNREFSKILKLLLCSLDQQKHQGLKLNSHLLYEALCYQLQKEVNHDTCQNNQ